CYMDFGYWKKNSSGSLDYTSISSKLNIPLIEDEQFWNIVAIDDYVLFQSLNQIYIYDVKNASYKIITARNNVTKMFRVDAMVYYQSLDDGIYKIENGQSQLMIDHPVLNTNNV